MFNGFNILLVNLAATWFMVGLIWFVQIVHYPQFAGVGHDAFIAYHHAHTRLTTWVVGPPMLVELATAIALLWVRPVNTPLWLVWIGLILLGLIWLSTAFVQVPRHDLLARGWDANVARMLVLTNWIRTVGWTARGVLVLWMFAA